MPGDDLTAALARIRTHLEHNDVQQVMGRDMPALLDLADKLRALAGEFRARGDVENALDEDRMWVRQECGTRLLKVMTITLLAAVPVIELRGEDLRIETYRGDGQIVPEWTGVKITHLPTGLTASAKAEGRASLLELKAAALTELRQKASAALLGKEDDHA